MTTQTVTKIKFNSLITGTAGLYRFTAMTNTGSTFTGIVSRDNPGEAWEARIGSDIVKLSMSRKHAAAAAVAEVLPA